MVGRACGHTPRAEAFVAALKRRVEAIAQRTRALSRDERIEVACLEWTDPPMIAGNWMPELLTLAGGRCAIDHARRNSQFVEWQAVCDTGPQVVVVMPCGFNLARAQSEGYELARQPGWSDLPAVKAGRVYAVDGNAYFNRSGPRLVDSLEILAHLVRPDLFAAPDIPDAFAAVSSGC